MLQGYVYLRREVKMSFSDVDGTKININWLIMDYFLLPFLNILVSVK